MKVKNSKWLLVAGLAIVLMTIGCQKQMGFVDDPQGDDVNIAATSTLPHQYDPGGSWHTYFHWQPPASAAYPMSIGNDAGGNGSVTVEKVGADLLVTYRVSDPWAITVTHVAVALHKKGIPHNKNGSLTPGKFPYKQDFTVPYPQVVTMTIPWKSSWDGWSGEGLFVVTHCEVKEKKLVSGLWDGHSYKCGHETGCGAEGELPPPPKKIHLPPDCVSMVYTGSGGSNASLNVQFWSADAQPGGPWDVKDGADYAAWSMDEDHGIQPGWPGMVTVHLWSCFDPALPLLWQHAHWGAVAWLINNRQEWGGLTMDDMQVIFYNLLDQTDLFPLLPNLADPKYVLYLDALVHDDFEPTEVGQFFPVVCAPNTWDFQVLFAEIPAMD